MSEADVRVGISGWRYPPWRGVFYPKMEVGRGTEDGMKGLERYNEMRDFSQTEEPSGPRRP